MIDREKIIKGLHCCSHTDGVNCVYCPYDNSDYDCVALMAMDVLALLKEQEPKTILGFADTIEGVVIGNCSRCHRLIVGKENDPVWFCKYCGQSVKWE